VKTTCPACGAILKTAGNVPVGKRCKCPKCGEPFAVPDRDAESVAARSTPARRVVPPVDDDDVDRERRGQRKKKRLQPKKKETNDVGLVIALSLGALLLTGAGILGVALWRSWGRTTEPIAQAKSEEPPRGVAVPQPPPGPPPQPPAPQVGGDVQQPASPDGPGSTNPPTPTLPVIPSPRPNGPVNPLPPAPDRSQKPTPPAGGDPVVGLKVGNLAPEIEGEDLDGKKFKLSDYRGKVVLLDFWGNW
jgi:uncharacterized Zn finger protein (UPF0148 family)